METVDSQRYLAGNDIFKTFRFSLSFKDFATLLYQKINILEKNNFFYTLKDA